MSPGSKSRAVPRTGSNQFIGREVAQYAADRELVPDDGRPAHGDRRCRFGSDSSCFPVSRGVMLAPSSRCGSKVSTPWPWQAGCHAIERLKPMPCSWTAVAWGRGGRSGSRCSVTGSSRFSRARSPRRGAIPQPPDRDVGRHARLVGLRVHRQRRGLIDDLTGPRYAVHLKGQVEAGTGCDEAGCRAPTTEMRWRSPSRSRGHATMRRQRHAGAWAPSIREALTEYDIFANV